MAALCLIARFHHLAADPATLAHQQGLAAAEPITREDILRAAQALGLKAKLSRTTQERLAAHTVGGVVTEAQALMVIVPEEAGVTAEVTLENKDVGFVNVGQDVEMKLETFPYTRYGTVKGTVARMTADAVNDEKRGALFPATVTLKQEGLDVDGRTIRLSPGMNLTAEIRTGHRRVIEYLLSPIQRAANESLKER